MKLTKSNLKSILETGSKEAQIKAIRLIESLERCRRSQKMAFHPNSAQKRVIASGALERYLFCANGTGKTAFLTNYIHWVATGYDPINKNNTKVPAKICLVLDSPQKINDFLEEYRKWNHLPFDWCYKKHQPHTN